MKSEMRLSYGSKIFYKKKYLCCYFLQFESEICQNELDQHHIETRPDHKSLATSQTSEPVGKAPKTCNSYPDAVFKGHH